MSLFPLSIYTTECIFFFVVKLSVWHTLGFLGFVYIFRFVFPYLRAFFWKCNKTFKWFEFEAKCTLRKDQFSTPVLTLISILPKSCSISWSGCEITWVHFLLLFIKWNTFDLCIFCIFYTQMKKQKKNKPSEMCQSVFIREAVSH